MKSLWWHSFAKLKTYTRASISQAQLMRVSKTKQVVNLENLLFLLVLTAAGFCSVPSGFPPFSPSSHFPGVIKVAVLTHTNTPLSFKVSLLKIYLMAKAHRVIYCGSFCPVTREILKEKQVWHCKKVGRLGENWNGRWNRTGRGWSSNLCVCTICVHNMFLCAYIYICIHAHINTGLYE